MRKLQILATLVLAAIGLVACNDDDTFDPTYECALMVPDGTVETFEAEEIEIIKHGAVKFQLEDREIIVQKDVQWICNNKK